MLLMELTVFCDFNVMFAGNSLLMFLSKLLTPASDKA